MTPTDVKRSQIVESTSQTCIPSSSTIPIILLPPIIPCNNVSTSSRATQTAVNEDFEVKVLVKYRGFVRSKIIRNGAEQLALKAILNNKGENTVIKSLAKDKKYRKEMLKVVNSEIGKELSFLTNSECPVFKGYDPNNEAVLTFDWKMNNDCFQTAAPYLHSVLASVSSLDTKRNVSYMLTSAAILLYSHSQRLSQLQYIVGLVLDSCGLTKGGIQILHDLGISVSYRAIIRKKKALVDQQKETIVKVLTGYLKHAETRRETDSEESTSDFPVGSDVDSGMQLEEEYAVQNNVENPMDSTSDLPVGSDVDSGMQIKQEYAVKNNIEDREDIASDLPVGSDVDSGMQIKQEYAVKNNIENPMDSTSDLPVGSDVDSGMQIKQEYAVKNNIEDPMDIASDFPVGSDVDSGMQIKQEYAVENNIENFKKDGINHNTKNVLEAFLRRKQHN
ncbi:uncharacterized protein [Argopecten irradians]|uniref:uncharacterized protein isoform X2 n=1 Tax=Argopecten irradians TaxID=31199 RepID=UPI003723BD43